MAVILSVILLRIRFIEAGERDRHVLHEDIFCYKNAMNGKKNVSLQIINNT